MSEAVVVAVLQLLAVVVPAVTVFLKRLPRDGSLSRELRRGALLSVAASLTLFLLAAVGLVIHFVTARRLSPAVGVGVVVTIVGLFPVLLVALVASRTDDGPSKS